MEFIVDFDTTYLRLILKRVRHEIDAPEEMLKNVGERLFNVNTKRQAEEKGTDGKPWEPLAPRTLARKRTNRMLVEHGDLLRTGFNYQIFDDTLHLGTSDYKGAFFQLGVRPHAQKRGHHPGMPARPYVGFPESDRLLVIDAIEDHLTEVLQRARG